MIFHARELVVSIQLLYGKKIQYRRIRGQAIIYYILRFINNFIANFAIQEHIPMLFLKRKSKALKSYNVGLLRLLSNWIRINAPLRRIGDIVNQSNLKAYFKKEPYPLDQNDLRNFKWPKCYRITPSIFQTVSLITNKAESSRILKHPEIAPKNADMGVVSKIDVKKHILRISFAKVIGDDYISALNITFVQAGLPPPLYQFPDVKYLRKNGILHCIVSTTMPDKTMYSETANGPGKKIAKSHAARQLYEILEKKYRIIYR